jgi:phosphoribosyl 1,2-cyclic phosphate phosphodiesterase
VKITFLGTGTSQGVPVIACKCDTCQSANTKDKRLRSSVLVEIDNQNLLIDAGPDFRQQMLRANVMHLSAILLTHSHKDHIAGLDDVRAFNWVEKKPIDIYAEKTVQKALKKEFAYVFARKKYPGVPQINLFEIKTKIFKINNIEVIPLRIKHLELPILGFRIGNFAYITDANHIPVETYHLLHNLDVLVINGLRWEEHISHFSLPEAIAEINKIKPKQAFITHIGHQLGKYEDVSAQLPPHIKLAYDELAIEVNE